MCVFRIIYVECILLGEIMTTVSQLFIIGMEINATISRILRLMNKK